MGITIKKAKIKDNLFLEVEYSEQLADGTNTVKKDCSAPVHDDMKAAFKLLNIHLGLLCYQIKEDALHGLTIEEVLEEVAYGLDPDHDFKLSPEQWNMVTDIFCKGFTIGGSDQHEGVTLIGYRILPNGKTLNLVSPFQKWEDDKATYRYTSELGQIIDVCIHEVKLYLLEGKHQPEAQMSLFEPEEEGEE